MKAVHNLFYVGFAASVRRQTRACYSNRQTPVTLPCNVFTLRSPSTLNYDHFISSTSYT